MEEEEGEVVVAVASGHSYCREASEARLEEAGGIGDDLLLMKMS